MPRTGQPAFRLVGAVQRAFNVLDALAEADTELGTNEIARRTGINASSVSRLLGTLVVGLGLVTLANWAGVTASQIGIAEATDVDRGTASAFYYSAYYFSGALGGYLPGLAWERFHWPGVAVAGWVALALAAAALALGPRR